MYTLNIFSALKKMAIKEIKGFTFENYYSQIKFPNEKLLFNETSEEKRFVAACN